MPAGSDAPIDPRFANLDATATIELCSSLADYGEAGGLSRDLMMQVGRFAEARFAGDLEVLLAVARMYLLGGEAERARSALVRAGKLAPDDPRVDPLLDHVLDLLEASQASDAPPESSPPPLPASPVPGKVRKRTLTFDDRADPDSSSDPTARPAPAPLHHPPTPAPALPPPISAKMTWAVSSAPVGKGKERRTFTPTTPIKAERRSFTPTTPTLEMKAERRRFTPTTPMTRMPGYGPAKPTTPMLRSRRPTPFAGMRAVAEAHDPADESPPPAQVRTDVSRRALGKDARDVTLGPVDSLRGLAPKSLPPARIRILDADDERRKLDPYGFIGEIASGGMATVFLGRLAGAGGFSRFVAIKQLHPHLAREEQFVQMFLDEARLAAGIHNPHVVPILEVGQSRGGYFLVMEFIEGDTLAGLTARLQKDSGTLPAPIALRIMVDALAGLHAAHQLTDADGVHLGLIHRDCTPQNILIGVDGSARITDFGVARAASRLAITRPQQVKGKVAYLSPEQAHAMDLDRRSDIFTMGIVLWETLARRPLFQSETEAATLSRVVSGPIPSVRSFVPDMPAALDEVCRRALHRDRNKRFRTAAEMAEALERAAEAEGFAGVASSRELGKFVETTMGAELLAQREAVRQGLAPKSSHVSSAAVRSQRAPASVRGTAIPVSGRGEPASEARPRAQEAPVSVAPVGERMPGTVAPPASKEEAAGAASPPPPVAAVKAAVRAADTEPLEKTLPATAPGDDAAARSTGRRQASSAPAGPGLLATVQALVARIAVFKVSTGRGIAMAVLLVIIATSPIWIKATNRMLHHGPKVEQRDPSERPPLPAIKQPAPSLEAPAPVAPRAVATAPTKAWDEGDWVVPEGGAGQAEPPAAVADGGSAAP